jgi:hypothetical protein
VDNTEQLKFVVDFANRDLQNQREGDWINLQEDLSRFFPIIGELSPQTIIFDPRQDTEAQRYPKPKLEMLQPELRALLHVRARPKGKFAIAPPMKIQLNYVPMSRGILVVGRIRDLFLQRVIFMLRDDKEADRIHQCPTCGKFFFRVRRQVHCSPQCADRANYQNKLQAEVKKKRGEK